MKDSSNTDDGRGVSARGLRSFLNGLRLLLEDWRLIFGGAAAGVAIAALCWWGIGLTDGGKAWRPLVFLILGGCLGTLAGLLLVMLNTWVALVREGAAAVTGPFRWYPLIKRTGDIGLASLLGFLLLVPMMLIALLVRSTSSGPALYWSDRIGRNGRTFRMPKFRSMRTDTPALATHLMTDPDQYLTPVGRFLRKTSLDELPQLWSIIVGDMSFVGPRPALFNQDDLIALRKEHGVDVLAPGLTGWAQVNGRDELPIPDKVQLDAEYLERQSFAFDMAIMWLTLVSVLSRKGISH